MNDNHENPLSTIGMSTSSGAKLKRLVQNIALLAGTPVAASACSSHLPTLASVALVTLLFVEVFRRIADIVNKLIDSRESRSRSAK